MMKKALYVLMILFLTFSTNQQVSATQTGTGDAAILNNTGVSSANDTADGEEVSQRLYDEGYSLGKEDGYNEKAYESFDEEACNLLSNTECDWYKAGYTVGYEKGKREKEAELQAQQEEEFKSGEESGYEQGLTDYKNKTIEPEPSFIFSQTKQWNEGYIVGYKKAIQLMDLSIKAKDEGYQQGLNENNMSIPSIYADTELTKKAFEDGFKAGEKIRIAALKKKYTKLGYEQGYELQPIALPEGIEENLRPVFEEAYQKGEETREREVTQAGFNAAFTYANYVTPKEYKDQPKLQEWHKKGYESNKDARKLGKAAHQAGKGGGNITIPKKYKDNKAAVAMYEKYYQLGKAERDQEIALMLVGGGILTTAAVLLGYMIIRRKKTVDIVK